MIKAKMKRYNHLYEQIISIENLNLADKIARRGKRGKHEVIIFDKHREDNILKLHEILKNNQYHPSPCHTFIIHDVKERTIYKFPYYPDCIVHHAIVNVMRPVWESQFISHTFACIVGRGINGCRNAVVKALKDYDNTQYCLKIDIHKYYPSVNHDILKMILRRKIKDNQLLCLLDTIIDSAEGLPIGNYLSQYFSNLYLTPFDHWIKENQAVKHYFRYADDMVFLGKNSHDLHDLFSAVKDYLYENFKLTLNDNYAVFKVPAYHNQRGRAIDFVGYCFCHNEVRLRKRIKQNLCRKIAKIKNQNISLKSQIQIVAPWLGWLKWCDSYYLAKKILNPKIYEYDKNKFKFRAPADNGISKRYCHLPLGYCSHSERRAVS